MTPDAGTTREDIFVELLKATAAVNEAAKLEDDARRVHISARNRLSDAQKAVDDFVNKLKVEAPKESPWAEKIRRDRAAAEDM